MYQIKWDITKKCFLHCSFCLNDEQRALMPDDLSSEDVAKVADNLISHRHLITGISFLGGEPTARTDFCEVVNRFAGGGIKLTLVTNGVKWSQKRYLELLRIPEVKNMVISLDSYLEEITDLVRGRGVHGRVIRSIKEIVAFKELNRPDIFLTINTVINKVNAGHLREFIGYCYEIGVNELSLLKMLCEGGAKRNCSDISLSLEELDSVIKIIGEEYAANKKRWGEKNFSVKPKFAYPLIADYAKARFGMELPKVGQPCNAGFGFAYLNHCGELYPCDRFTPDYERYRDYTPVSVDKISLLNTQFGDAINSESFRKLHRLVIDKNSYSKVEPCNTCKYLHRGCTPCPMGRPPGSAFKIEECLYYHERADLSDTVKRPFLLPDVPELATNRSRYRVNPSVSDHIIGGKLHLLDARDSSHLVLSACGANIWQRVRNDEYILPVHDNEIKFISYLKMCGVIEQCLT